MNEEWSEVAVRPSKEVSVLCRTSTLVAAAEPLSSPLEDFLNCEDHGKYPYGFTLLIPSDKRAQHSPATFKYEETNKEEGACGESTTSELTLMTYRAELMKQVSDSREIYYLRFAHALICGTTANSSPFFLMIDRQQAIMIEYEKFKQEKKQLGVVVHPAMFSRSMSCSRFQHRLHSFVNDTSIKMKHEARKLQSTSFANVTSIEMKHEARKLHSIAPRNQARYAPEDVAPRTTKEHSDWSGTEECVSNDASFFDDPTMLQRVDELYVEFGVRPVKPIPSYLLSYETKRLQVNDECVDVQEALADQHIKEVIQLKLQLAQKQSFIDDLSSKYNSLLLEKHRFDSELVQPSVQQNMQEVLADNTCLKQENEKLRAQLLQMQQPSPSAIDDFHNHMPSSSQPSRTFNIHQEIQDRIKSRGRVFNTFKGDATANKTLPFPPKFLEFESLGTSSTQCTTTDSSTMNDSPPSQIFLNQVNSFSNLFQGWRRNSLDRSLTMRSTSSLIQRRNKYADSSAGKDTTIPIK
jgi:hypothetical protein